VRFEPLFLDGQPGSPSEKNSGIEGESGQDFGGKDEAFEGSESGSDGARSGTISEDEDGVRSET
jgi:hypothetical protein